MNPDIFNDISYGVYVVSSVDGDRPTGCIVNSIIQVSAVPATMAISIHHDNFTTECIEKTGVFAISILSEKTDPKTISVFGFRSGRNYDKFAVFPYRRVDNLPVLEDSCGYILCKVIGRMESPTHTVFLGEVTDGDVIGTDTAPMTYAFYHRELKGKTSANAPTFKH